jgi:hypothetical protein
MDKTTLDKAFGGQSGLELILYYHSTPLPYTLAEIMKAKSEPIKSSLTVGGVAEPIYHEKNGTTANVWGLLNVKDRATVGARTRGAAPGREGRARALERRAGRRGGAAGGGAHDA